jgi:hypothetical protein
MRAMGSAGGDDVRVTVRKSGAGRGSGDRRPTFFVALSDLAARKGG